MNQPVYAILVTHDSAKVLPRCLEALAAQSRPPDRIVIVDSGSQDNTYLKEMPEREGLEILLQPNIGFSRANNVGVQALPQRARGMVVFLNPDTFLQPDNLAMAVDALQEHQDVAIVGGRLSGCDPGTGQPTGRLDSTGIFRKWYGRWYDRGKGEIDRGQYNQWQYVPAICGALMCCRLESFTEFSGAGIFNERFFLYKEDIELSLRLRKTGWKLLYNPEIKAYHCRGWNSQRKNIPSSLRLQAARSEILLYREHPSPYMAWAVMKYLLVRLLRC